MQGIILFTGAVRYITLHPTQRSGDLGDVHKTVILLICRMGIENILPIKPIDIIVLHFKHLGIR